MARPRTVLTGKEKAADPSTDFLGERTWKAVARQHAIEVLQYQLEQAKLVSPGSTDRARTWVDAILGTIGPFYEAAIRDAVLQFIDVMDHGTYPDGTTDALVPPTGPPAHWWDDEPVAWITAFLWRQIPPEKLEEVRRG
jgi:hypothetical protein